MANLSSATEPADSGSTENVELYASEELLRFSRLFEQIRQLYVDEISDAELLDMATQGLLEQLDPHSEYLDPERQTELRENTEGTYNGIGVELTMQEGDLTIITPLDNSPASEAGVQAGDIILRIDGNSTLGLTLQQALRMMDEIVERELKLLIQREADEPFEVSLTREPVALESVTASTLAHDVGYVRISQFQADTGVELDTQLQTLIDEHPYLVGLVLDLRNNPGGVLQAAIEVTDNFISGGLIVSTKGRDPGANSEFYATPGGTTNLPIVVIINRGSASAAEIVAGALQDHDRGIILGDISFGKGTVQNVIPIDDDHAIKLTTARYFTPSGRSIQAQGIYPDITVLDGEIRFSELNNIVSEASLQRHLETDDNAPELLGFRDTLGDITDVQLSQAVSILKGLALRSR